MYQITEETKKWEPILEHAGLPKIKDDHRKAITAICLENTAGYVRAERAALNGGFLTETSSVVPSNLMGGSSSTTGTGGLDTFDPVLISLVRRTMPNLMAYDLCGVQAMTGPSGMIFAMRSKYGNQGNGTSNASYGGTQSNETFYNEVNDVFSTIASAANTFGAAFTGTFPGANSTSPLTNLSQYNTGAGMPTAQGEALGSDANTDFGQMAISIDKFNVIAKTRALKAEYTIESAQDMKAMHGLDMATELSNLLATEILAEINREVVRTINITGVVGAQTKTTTVGIFDCDTDSNGRWSAEKWKGLIAFIDMEANQIAKETRFGKGNVMIVSSNVATALSMAGLLTYTPKLDSDQLNVDDTGNTFVGLLLGRIKVYIDPYQAGTDYCTIGFKGDSITRAGLFYCPYIPLMKMQTIDQATAQPKIFYKTRYGIAANPFAEGLNKGAGALNMNSNKFYRKFLINNLM